MPLTEFVIVVSTPITYLTAVILWIAHSGGAGTNLAGQAGHGARLKRPAFGPAAAVLGGLPVFVALWLIVVWRIIPAWS